MATQCVAPCELPYPSSWRISSGHSTKSLADRLVLDRSGGGILDLRVQLLVREAVPDRRFDLLRLVVAACTSEGIRRDTGIVSWLHWPDLVTIDDRVVARTTLALTAPPQHDRRARIAMGIAVRCFPNRLPAFAPPLPSTSIEGVLGVKIDLALLRDKILHAVDWYHAEWERGMDEKLAERIRPTIPWIGQEVEATLPGLPPARGLAKGLDAFGSLLLDVGDGGGATTLTLRPGLVEVVRVVD